MGKVNARVFIVRGLFYLIYCVIGRGKPQIRIEGLSPRFFVSIPFISQHNHPSTNCKRTEQNAYLPFHFHPFSYPKTQKD